MRELPKRNTVSRESRMSAKRRDRSNRRVTACVSKMGRLRKFKNSSHQLWTALAVAAAAPDGTAAREGIAQIKRVTRDGRPFLPIAEKPSAPAQTENKAASPVCFHRGGAGVYGSREMERLCRAGKDPVLLHCFFGQSRRFFPADCCACAGLKYNFLFKIAERPFRGSKGRDGEDSCGGF